MCRAVSFAVSNALGGHLCSAEFDPIEGQFLVTLAIVDAEVQH